MEALLDTHVVIWWFENAPRLSKRAAAILASPGNTLVVSAAVGWEISIKVNAGKLESSELIGDVHGYLAREGWLDLPISMDHAVRAGLLPLHHRDPFDRLLVAQAQALNLPILSADRGLDEYDVRRLW
jgi:PIN domain nuclease of toxin-antitoxin system